MFNLAYHECLTLFCVLSYFIYYRFQGVFHLWLHPSFLSHEVRVHYKKKFNRTDRKSTCPRLHLIPMEYTPWNFIKFEVNFSWLKKKKHLEKRIFNTL